MADGREDADRIERVFREQYGRAVSVLVRAFGDIELAEESVQDAFATAIRRWPSEGPPPSPAGWIITTARNRAIDRLRRDSSLADRHAQAALVYGENAASGAAADQTVTDASEVPDDRLRLIFTCCHPALSMPARVALTLRLLGGLETAAIARAFFTTESTMAQRLVRAKRKIRDARIAYRVPSGEELAGRVDGVLAVIYLIFNAGHTAGQGDRLVREDLCAEAIRLGELLHELMPDDPEVGGLLALMLLVDSRSATRTDADGRLVLLADQDRSRWDRHRIARARTLLRQAIWRGRIGSYQLQAAIQAVHAEAARYADTDWAQIVRLYDQLLASTRDPVVALNRAVAVAEIDGPAAGLRLVDELELGGYYMFHSVRADLLRRSGRAEEAAAAYRTAMDLTENAAERAFLRARLDQVSASEE